MCVKLLNEEEQNKHGQIGLNTRNKNFPDQSQSQLKGGSVYSRPTFYRPESVSYLSQRPLLFARSIKENIVLEKEFDQKKLNEVLRNAGMEDDMKMMNDGIDQNIGENGNALSGGQRIRLALARC